MLVTGRSTEIGGRRFSPSRRWLCTAVRGVLLAREQIHQRARHADAREEITASGRVVVDATDTAPLRCHVPHSGHRFLEALCAPAQATAHREHVVGSAHFHGRSP
ncbi:hypothetical protein C7S15_8962 (plasmid) [Burkholderia cepacia]|nr:hypothetical protein [Burkholderia cepacia]